MGNYIKVSPFVAHTLGLTEIRQQTADGNYLLWQQDIAAIEGETLEERSKFIGGAILDRPRSKEEIQGTEDPASLIDASDEDLPEDQPEAPKEELQEDPESVEEEQPVEEENLPDEEISTEPKKRRKNK